MSYLKCGDCLNLIKELKDKSIDLVITSPPYNMTKRKGGYGDTGRYDVYVDWKPEDEYINWIIELFNSFNRVLVDNGIILFNFSYSIENPSLPYKLIAKLVDNTEFDVVDTIIWKKKSGIPFSANGKRLSRNWEYIFVISRKSEMNTITTNRQIRSVSEKTGQKYYDVVYNFVTAANNDSKCELNQAAFSTELVKQLLAIYSSSENDTVLDPFMGTGTTAVACVEMRRQYVGFELSKQQYEYALNRLDNVKPNVHQRYLF